MVQVAEDYISNDMSVQILHRFYTEFVVGNLIEWDHFIWEYEQIYLQRSMQKKTF